MSKILFTGSSGLVGSRVYDLLKDQYDFTTISLSNPLSDINLDLTDYNSLVRAVSDIDFNLIYHFAGFTAVDEAELQREDNKGTCYINNVLATDNLIKVANDKNAKIVFISTDFVFNGKNGPYKEGDKTGSVSDLSWYGWTKKVAEDHLLQSGNKHQIIRISYPFRNNFSKGDFARDIISKMNSNSLYPLFNDQFITPTFVDSIADFLSFSLSHKLTGIYHIASSDVVTPYSFAQSISQTFNIEYKIDQGSILDFQKNFPTKAKRPINGGLNTKKVQALKFPILTSNEYLQILKTQLNSKSDKISK